VDQEALAAAAAAALVAAMTTDTWQVARSAVVKLWRRVSPNRRQAIREELGEVRQLAIEARGANDAKAENVLVSYWEQRLLALIAADPKVAADLQTALEEVLLPRLPSNDRRQISKIVMTAKAADNSRVYQAGRDIHVTE
jgi:hypothetical protein